MITTVLLFALGAGTASGTIDRDTTFSVPARAHVRILNPAGDIEVRAVPGREGRALADGESDGIEIRRSGDQIRVRLDGMYVGADLQIRLPRDVSLELRGADGAIRVKGFGGSVSAEILDGDIDIEGASSVEARSVDGDVRVHDVSGPVSIETGEGDTHLADVTGPIVVNGVDGDIVVEGGSAHSVELSTVSGDLWYGGSVYDDGEYSLATHDGDVTFTVADDVGAHVEVLTYDGGLLPSFPIQLRGEIGSTAEFTLGSGSARVSLASFDGDIYLIRPGERSPQDENQR